MKSTGLGLRALHQVAPDWADRESSSLIAGLRCAGRKQAMPFEDREHEDAALPDAVHDPIGPTR
jgi:hypothetical protein